MNGADPIDTIPTWLDPFKSASYSAGIFSNLEISERLASLPIVITFFSLRGGVGRSTAMVHSASELSRLGYKVVCLDADFEAPSLDRQFGIESSSLNSPGLLQTLVELEMSPDSGMDILNRLIRVGDDDLYVFPAGQIDHEYIKTLRWLDTEVWYTGDTNPFTNLISILRESDLKPDYILVDARTGFNQINAPMLFRESDLAVIVMSPTEQSFRGNEILAAGLRKSVNFRGNAVEWRYILSPIPQNFRYATEAIALGHSKIIEWWKDYEIEDIDDYVCSVFYDEKIATSANTNEVADRSAYQPIVKWLSSIIPSEYENEDTLNIAEERKKEILRSLYAVCDRNTGVAEQDQDIEEFFFENIQYQKLTSDRISIIIGRKGTGKTALFRHFISKYNAIALSSPRHLQSLNPLTPTRTVYSEWAELHGNDVGSWRKFWLLQFLSIVSGSGRNFQQMYGNLNENDIVKAFESLKSDNISNGDRRMIVADGLDDGFGSSEADALMREAAIAGLIDFWYHYASEYKPYVFKFLIRHDLWNRISVVNKSHLQIYTEEIKWNLEDYLTIVIRLSCQSKEFAEYYIDRYAPSADIGLILKVIDFQLAWNIIFGERMDTGKSSFTRNWVWKRLSDANNEHSVRMLINLYKYSISKELREIRPYKTLIRPKSLIEALPSVSEQALLSLSEEYRAELSAFISALSELNNTPFYRKDINFSDENTIAFAKNVGLVFERTDQRLSIPDLYRHPLGISRKGQR